MIEFTKAQGIGNDFVIIDLLSEHLDYNWNHLAIEMCDRNFGVGADGLILVLPSDAADYRMRIINSDGTEPEMCGNGIRCFARYLLDNGLAHFPLSVETLAGVMEIDIADDAHYHPSFKVNMGAPIFEPCRIPVNGFDSDIILSQALHVDGQEYKITCVSMGNPHCVIFVDDADSVPLEEIGPKIEEHPAFPMKTNVEFVQVMQNGELKIRVWERGAGITLACGTGACASVVASILNGLISRKPTTAHLPGGDLIIDWSDSGEVYMTGPAEIVFIGRYIV